MVWETDHDAFRLLLDFEFALVRLYDKFQFIRVEELGCELAQFFGREKESDNIPSVWWE
jgi:hypothetical protein